MAIKDSISGYTYQIQTHHLFIAFFQQQLLSHLPVAVAWRRLTPISARDLEDGTTIPARHVLIKDGDVKGGAMTPQLVEVNRPFSSQNHSNKSVLSTWEYGRGADILVQPQLSPA